MMPDRIFFVLLGVAFGFALGTTVWVLVDAWRRNHPRELPSEAIGRDARRDPTIGRDQYLDARRRELARWTQAGGRR